MNKRIIKLIIIFLIIGVIILSYFLIRKLDLFNDNYDKYVTFETRKEKVKNYKVSNAKVIGWLQVQGTDIDYPVIEETQEAYESGIDYIWRVNDYVDGENRMAIYGHNILNVSSQPLIRHPDHTRFEQLMSFVYYDFAKENLYIYLNNNGKDEIYKIYAVSFCNKEDDSGDSYKKSEIDDYIKSAKISSIYDYDVDVNDDDQLISLITCTRFFGVTGYNQFKIDARKIRKNEKIKKYNVEINENYDIIK